MKKVINFLKSVKLAIGLFIFITLTALLATLIPQARNSAFYIKNYGTLLGNIILFFQYNRFFFSMLFLIPLFLFTLNLFLCTLDRMIRRFKNKAQKRFGPDIIHIGLLLLIIFGFYTFASRQEKMIYLGINQEIEILSKYTLKLKDFQSLKYEDGRPKQWISKVDLTEGEKKIFESFSIEVNKPLEYKHLTIYQSDFDKFLEVELLDSDGNSAIMKKEQFFSDQGHNYLLAGEKEGKALFEFYQGEKFLKYIAKEPGDFIGPFIISKINIFDRTGLKIVQDPSALFIMAGLLLVILGLGLTYYQKLGETKL